MQTFLTATAICIFFFSKEVFAKQTAFADFGFVFFFVTSTKKKRNEEIIKQLKLFQ